MEMKTKILDKKHIIVISITIISILIGIISYTYAYFSDRKDKDIKFESASNFGGSTIQKTDVVLNGDLPTGQRLSNTVSISFDVTEKPYNLSLIAEVDPNETTFLEENSSSLTYEVYHKTNSTLDTSGFTCNNNEYINVDIVDYCETGTLEDSLDGMPISIINKYYISDSDTHYFDVYINNNELDTHKIKVSFYFVYNTTFKPGEEYLNAPDISNGLVPVKYVTNDDKTGNWVITTKEDEEWYDYDKQIWANAVSLDLTTDEKKTKLLNEDGTYKVGTELTLPDGTSNDSDVLAMFVWIPRFSYTIGCTDIRDDSTCLGYRLNDGTDPDALSTTLPGAIDIKFIKKNTKDLLDVKNGEWPNYEYSSNDNRTPSNWYTHPAFTFGEEELSGIWVGKFETSTATSASCYNSTTHNCSVGATEVRILPNVTSMRYQQIANLFSYSQYFSASNNIYGLTGDSHMMKNSEWAAVAYLSQSIYGKYGNSVYSGANKEIYINNYYNTDTDGFITGVSAGETSAPSSTSIVCRYNEYGENRTEKSGSCGEGASTTGNIYGVYDMNGGANDYVMVYYYNKPSSSGFDDLWFENDDNLKYYDKFTTINPFSVKSLETIGQAFVETKSWYSDYAFNGFSSETPWASRGGFYGHTDSAGVYFGSSDYGDYRVYTSFRSALVVTGA